MNRRLSLFNVTSLVLGFAFLYLPILLLVVYSFNASRLVTVWGGFSTQWYGALFRNEALMEAAWVTLRIALPLRDARDRSRHARGARAHPLRALSRAHALHRHGLCADGHARGHHRPVAAAVLRRHRPRPRLLDGHACAYDAHHVLRHRGGAGAAHDLRPLAGRGGDGSRRAAAAHLLHRDAAADRAVRSWRAFSSPSPCRSTIS